MLVSDLRVRCRPFHHRTIRHIHANSVRMLGTFVQFERDVIIDRVTGGMERAAAKGKWTTANSH